jgi:hypothetical protein
LWVRPQDSTDLEVRWQSGLVYKTLGSVKYPNILSSTTEGKWKPAPGFDWDHPSDNTDLAVHWSPGKSYYFLDEQRHPHIVASETEKVWRPEPGYEWDNATDSTLTVHWQPGIPYRVMGKVTRANILSSRTEGSWIPAPNYAWAHRDSLGRPIPGELDVVLDSVKAARSADETMLLDHWVKYLEGIQADNTYPNWSAPPATLYRSKHGGS